MRQHSNLARTLLAPAALLAAATLSSGCADNNSSVFIIGNMAPTEQTEEGCSYEPDLTASLYPGGLLDVSLTDSYVGHLLIANQMADRGDKDRLRTETARFVVRGAEVLVTDVMGGVLANYTTTVHAVVSPGNGEDPGVAVAQVAMVPAGGLGGSSGGQILSEVRLFGETLGNQEFETNTMVYPIGLCDGCLRRPPEPGEPDCSTATPPCFRGQDMGACVNP